ncbi:MAG: GtrA family protein [Bacteroidales bacterium]|nr:GtrA family protein [Bacteroidales bacterium]
MTKVFFEKAIRLFKFSLSTLAGTAVDMLVLWIFKQFVFKGWYYGEYMISPVISFFFAVLTNFSLAYFIVWKDRVSKRSVRSFFRHFAGYGISSLGGFIVKMGLLLLIERIFHWDVLICNLVALCFSGLLNFALNEWVVFGKRKPQDPNQRLLNELTKDK